MHFYTYNIVTCEKLTAPMNGNVTYANSTKTDATTSGPYPIGTIATYMCEATYSIIGTNIRECNNSGQFNGSAPTCQRNSFDTLHVKLTMSVYSFEYNVFYMHASDGNKIMVFSYLVIIYPILTFYSPLFNLGKLPP